LQSLIIHRFFETFCKNRSSFCYIGIVHRLKMTAFPKLAESLPTKFLHKNRVKFIKDGKTPMFRASKLV
jgi:hypothetical protein